MTQTSTVNRVSAAGDGATTVFAFNNFVEDAGDLEVWLRSAAGVQTLQTLASDYSLAGLGSAAVSVTMFIAPAVGERLVIIRREPHTNEVAVDAIKTFRAQAFEDQFDRIARGQQSIADAVGRAIRLRETDLEDATGAYDANSRKIINVGEAVGDHDAVNKSQMMAAVAAGQAGPQGERGPQPGHGWAWDIATVDADQGEGKVWGNDASLAGITLLFFNKLDYAGADVTGWLTRLDDSTTTDDRGTLLIEKQGDKTQWAEFSVTGALTATGNYYKVPVSGIGSAGSFAGEDEVVASFSRSGNAGAGDGDFRKDGSVAMSGNFDGGGNDITNVGNISLSGDVDGRNVAADGTKLDAIYKTNKYDATASPTADDDSADTSGNGVFSVGSRWIDVSSDEVWECVDASATAAIWKNLSAGSAGGEAGMVDVVIAHGVDNSGATDTSSSLQSAINAITTAGQIVYIPPGAYDLDEAAMVIPDGGRVIAASTAELRRSVDPSTAAACINLGSDCIWQGGHITNTLVAAQVNAYNCGIRSSGKSRTRIFQARVTGNFYVGIMLESSTECSVESCQVEVVKNRGIYVYQANADALVSNCLVDGGGVTDYAFNINPAGAGACTRLRVIGCTANNCVQDGYVIADNTYYSSVVGCVADNVGNTGFLIEIANGGFPQWNNLSGCVAHACTAYGFQLYGSYYNNIGSCEAVSCGTGYYFNGCQHNTIGSSRADSSTTAGSQPGDGFRVNATAHYNDLNGVAATVCAGTGILIETGSFTTRVNGRSRANATQFTDNGSGTVADVTTA